MRSVIEREMIGESPRLRAVLEQVSLVAPSTCAVLIQGKLRCHSRGAAGKRVVRPRTRRLHRELQNFIERAVLFSTGEQFRPPLSELTHLISARSDASAQTLAEMERAFIVETLENTRWVVGGREGAAARLGLARTTVISRMHKLGISRNTPPAPWPPGMNTSAKRFRGSRECDVHQERT